MEKEDLLSQIHESRMASVVMGWLDPVFDNVEENLLNSLKSNFRSGTYTELLLACHVAQLVALEDLKTKIKGIAVRGDYAQKELEKEKGLGENDDGDSTH